MPLRPPRLGLGVGRSMPPFSVFRLGVNTQFYVFCSVDYCGLVSALTSVVYCTTEVVGRYYFAMSVGYSAIDVFAGGA